MKNSTRRKFLRNSSLTATGLLLLSRTGARKNARRTSTITCAPVQIESLTGSVASVTSGNWSDAATWGGKVPGAADTPLINSGHTVVFDLKTTTVAGINVNSGGTLQFGPSVGGTIETTKNVIVQGKLQMRPNTPTVIHTLRFTGVDETKFVGGGMDVLDSDVGLWVMGSGQLDLAGSQKTSWTRAGGAVAAGTASVAMEAAPAGWLAGDEISIAPTEPPTVGGAFATGFDLRTITSVSGANVSLNTGVSRAHPKVNNLWTAEVMNLTRNVRIEGTLNKRTHVFIRSTVPQFIKYVALRYMGPRKDRGGDSTTELIAGRYGIHFHHCMDGSRGSIVEGTVIRDCDNHSYVPHISHGVKVIDSIAYNTMEIAFWFDPGDPTHDVMFDHNIVAGVKFLQRALNMNAEDAPTFSSSGFSLNSGDGNTCKNNVVVGGGMGDPADGGAYNWEATLNEGIWNFSGNMSHNNDCGLRVWQNSTRNHVINNFTAYHNGLGIFHGAYANSYTYNGGYLFGNGVQLKAASVNSNRVRFENITIDGGGMIDNGIEIIHSPLPGERPLHIRNITIRNCKKNAILDVVEPEIHSADIIQCNITGAITLDSIAVAGETLRIQPLSGTPNSITKSGKGNIGIFAPTLWGTGTGLKGEYFNNSGLTGSPILTRVDSNVSFTEWSAGIHYAITGNAHSMRWTGKVQPQYSEAYTFILESGGGSRLWVNGKLILDKWSDAYPDSYKSSPIDLVAGQQYDIKIEYFNKDERTGMCLGWTSKSLAEEYVPQSQLYTDAVSSPPPTDPVNKPPVANAGTDITITLPSTSITLNGSASSDPDGTVDKYKWTKISGPAAFKIGSDIAATTQVTGLAEGTYVFRLQVTDNKGLTNEDDVTVTVKPAATTPANKPPVANAGADITITLPTNSTTLTGMGTDPDGQVASYKWEKISGPTTFKIVSDNKAETVVNGLVEGSYVFKLTVVDNKGASTEDSAIVYVKKAATTPPANKPPVANAGSDITITLPTNSTTLKGSGTDTDGTVKTYKWTRVSGPTTFTLASSSAAISGLSGLVEGTYSFRLTVTDDKGASSSDDVTVVVKPAKTGPTNPTDPHDPEPPILLKPLEVTAYPNPSTSVFKLKIKSSSDLPITVRIYDSRGNLVTRITKVSNDTTLTVGAFLRRGQYTAVAEQGYQKKIIKLIKY